LNIGTLRDDRFTSKFSSSFLPGMMESHETEKVLIHFVLFFYFYIDFHGNISLEKKRKNTGLLLPQYRIRLIALMLL